MVIQVTGHPRYIKKRNKLKDERLTLKIDDVLDELKVDINKGNYDVIKPYPSIYERDDVTNLYNYPIYSHRLIYTIVGTKRIKTYIILDLLTHKEYDVIFGYNTS